MGSRDQRPSPHLCLTKQHFALRSPSANEEQASKPCLVVLGITWTDLCSGGQLFLCRRGLWSHWLLDICPPLRGCLVLSQCNPQHMAHKLWI